MCILCDNETLEQLTTPLERVEPGQLAESIRTAREAAAAGVLDHVELVLRGEAKPAVSAEFFGDVVVARALEAGVLTSSDAYGWGERLRRERVSSDPRVLAFLSSCAEIIDDYSLVLSERRQVLDRFVEAHGDAVQFSCLGRDGELWFDYQGELYCALGEDEALEIVERELSGSLHSIDPAVLLRYTTLPEPGLEVLEGILARPPEVANPLLAGLIELPALADDRVRSGGFGPFFQGEHPRPVEDLRFGEWIIIRVPVE